MSLRTFGRALGELIFQKRMAAGLSQLQLSEDAFGSSAKTRRISELETGSVANPHLKTINPIINALGITDDEIEACAKQASKAADTDLDRAFREARNLIDALALQFEHAQPEATLAQLDDFLRGKAREWRFLRDRIGEIDELDETLSSLKDQAAAALAEGGFDDVDALLSQAEAQHQEHRTLKEVRSQAGIRISRGDNALLAGNPTAALDFYRSAVRFFGPFDEREMVSVAQGLAERVYEASRRSLDPAFFIASELLEEVWPAKCVKDDGRLRASIAYRLGLIFKNHHLSQHGSPDLLDRAIAYSRLSVEYEGPAEDLFGMASMKINLANCLIDKSKREDDATFIHESIDILRSTRTELETSGEFKELLAHVCNSLGSALLTSLRWKNDLREEDVVADALGAFFTAVAASEACSDAEVWGAAKTNIGGVLAQQSRADALAPYERAFLKVRAIAEFTSALETYPSAAFPYKFADIHISLARVLVDYATDGAGPHTELYLFRAVQSYEAAATVYEKEAHPQRWAELQSNIGAVLLFHARMDGVQTQEHDYPMALKAYQAAYDVSKERADLELAEHCLKIINQILTEQAAG